jgi:tetratricopeptide (TPR) repeat protein
MALTHCKECKNEVSAEAKTCPYCGIDNPGTFDKNNRRVGAVVLAMLIFLCIYILIGHEKTDYPHSENTVISENKEAAAEKADHKPNVTKQANSTEAPTEQSSTPLQQPTQTGIQQSPVNRSQPEQENLEPDKTRNISSTDTPQILVMRMLEYALKNGGLSHEPEIQQTKLQIESLYRPAEGNKRAARRLNASGLELSKKGSINAAVKIFEEANESDKSDVEIINNLGFSYLKQGNLDSAQQAITFALTMSPGRATAWENLGEVFGIKGDISKSAACFSNAYRFSPDSFKFHQYMKIINEKEDVKSLKQARVKAIDWADKSYLNISGNADSKAKVKLDLKSSKK